MATPQRAHAVLTRTPLRRPDLDDSSGFAHAGLAIWNAMLWVRNGVCRPD